MILLAFLMHSCVWNLQQCELDKYNFPVTLTPNCQFILLVEEHKHNLTKLVARELETFNIRSTGQI